MVKRIVILSREKIESYIDNKYLPDEITGKWALISIYREEEVITTFKRIESLKNLNCNDYISVCFSDIEKPIEPPNDSILFNEEHAKIIIDFIDKIKDKVDVLVVHCAAGISRSGGVGLFACRYLNLDEIEFRKKNIICPNMHVVKVLNTISGIDDDYLKLWQDLTEKRTLNKGKIRFI